MKPFELFRSGKHVSASGAAIAFSDDDLRAAVAAYDPAVHEAPIVVGHPRDNAPAYGWVKSLSFADGTMIAEPDQVDADFAELVQAGRFKKRSASFYTPDAPNNPKPGTYYLRHVGFLGAQPPAVKGLKEVAFADAEAGVVEFADVGRFAWGSVAAILRGLREWIIGDKGLETADKLVPNFYLSDIDEAAKAAREAPVDQTPSAMPAFSEGNPMTIQELQAQVAKLTKERDDALAAAAKVANFSEAEGRLKERETAVAAREAAMARASIEKRVDAVVAAGRLLPAGKKAAVDFAMALADGEQTFDFGEGDKAKKVSQREAYLLQLETAPKVVEYGERAPSDGGRPATGGELSVEDAQRQLLDQVAGKAKA